MSETVKPLKQDVVDDLIKDELSKNEKKSKKEQRTKWETFKLDARWEINHFWRNNFVYPYKSVMTGFGNFWRYRKLIWNDRWWDHTFFLEWNLAKLKDMEDHWGKDTHYVDDTVEKETLKKLVEDLEWMLESDEFDKDYVDEYKKRSRSFFGRLDRHHRKLWD